MVTLIVVHAHDMEKCKRVINNNRKFFDLNSQIIHFDIEYLEGEFQLNKISTWISTERNSKCSMMEKYLCIWQLWKWWTTMRRILRHTGLELLWPNRTWPVKNWGKSIADFHAEQQNSKKISQQEDTSKYILQIYPAHVG